MPTRIIDVYHRETDRKTRLPESALATFPDYSPTPSQARRDNLSGDYSAPTVQVVAPLPDKAAAGKDN